jgi:hypothetical protein
VKVFKYAIILLLVTSPMYWFFSLSGIYFEFIKKILLGLCLFLGFIFYNNNKMDFLKEQAFFATAVGWILIVSIFNYLNEWSIIAAIIPFIYIAFLLFIFTKYISKIHVDELNQIIVFMNFFYIFVSVLVLLNFFNLITINTPSLYGSRAFYTTGFGTVRTGWSGGIAMLVYFNIYFLIKKLVSDKNIKIVFVGTILIVIMQAVSGGRGGLFLSLSMLLVLSLSINKKIFFYLVIIAVASFIALIPYFDLIDSYLRLDRYGGEGKMGLTSGRFDHFILSMEYLELYNWVPSGAKGYINFFEKNGVYAEIHNVWLKLFIEFGIILPIILFIFILTPFYKDKIIFLLFIISIMPTMIEPQAIVINIGNYIPWWFVFVFQRIKTKQ